MKQHHNKQLFWFLTNRQLLIYFLLLTGSITLNITNIMFYLRFLEVQKEIQNGNVIANWKSFLVLSLSVAILTAILEIYNKVYEMLINKYLRFNLFLKYRKTIQVYENPVKLKCELVGNIFGCFDTLISIILNGYLVFKTAELIKFDTNTIICAFILLVSAITFGILRGLKRANISQINVSITNKESDLTKFYTFSKNFMENALTVLGIEHNSRIKENVKTAFLTELPAIMKESMVIISVYGLIKTLAENEVYSNAYIIMSAYTIILTVAQYISSVFENVFTCIQIARKKDIKILDEYEKREKFVLKEARKNITSNKSGITIFQNFTANINDVDKVRYYSLSTNLKINFGENIILIGSKGTGKTRLLQILESLYEYHIMIYNDHTKVFGNFYDNFKSDIGWNYELIQKLAIGLKLKRFQLPEEELKKLQVSNINTGDSHLLVALIMLYYAVSKPEQAKVIILDELLANIDKENSKEILEFIYNIGKEIGSTFIFVGHSQQKEIIKYCTKKWSMHISGASVVVEEKML